MTIQDAIEIVVDKISSIARPVYFQFASWKEVCEELDEKNKDKTLELTKYPLIVVHRDFTETFGKKVNEVDELKVYILAPSELKYNSAEREKQVITPTIKPIYDDFIAQLKRGSRFLKENRIIEHSVSRVYNMYVGTEKQNKLPETLDAIEINFKNLKYIKILCHEL